MSSCSRRLGFIESDRIDLVERYLPTTPNVYNIYDEVLYNAKQHFDLQLEEYEIEVNYDGEFRISCEELRAFGFNNTVPFSDMAVCTLMSRKRVPINFIRRCSRHLRREISKEFVKDKMLFRFVGKNNPICRGVLSPTFSTSIDDQHVWEVLSQSLKHLLVKSFITDNHISRSIIYDPKVEPVKHGVFSILPAISITNSEIGLSSLWIEPALSINGTVLTNKNQVITEIPRIIHRGEIKSDRVKEAVFKSNEIAQAGVFQFIESLTKENLPNIDDLQKSMESNNETSSRFVKQMFLKLREEEYLNDQSVLSSIFQEVKNLPLMKSIAFSKSIGSSLNLFTNHKSRMKTILKTAQNNI